MSIGGDRETSPRASVGTVRAEMASFTVTERRRSREQYLSGRLRTRRACRGDISVNAMGPDVHFRYGRAYDTTRLVHPVAPGGQCDDDGERLH